MKNKIFKAAAILGASLALLTCTIPVQSQERIYAPQPLTLWTNWVLASTNRLYTNTVIDCNGQRNVALQITTKVDAAGGVVTYAFQPSVDGITFADARLPIQVADPGVAGTTVVTNIDTLGYGYLRLSYITNAHATANVTNIVLKYSIKLGAP